MSIDPDPDLPEVERAAREWLAQLGDNYFQRFNPPYHADLIVRALLAEVDRLRQETEDLLENVREVQARGDW